MLLESTQPLNPTDLYRTDASDGQSSNDQSSSLSTLLDGSPSPLRRLEIWSGRLAMFSLTTMLIAIAINPQGSLH
jgi:hypothetical protein